MDPLLQGGDDFLQWRHGKDLVPVMIL